MTKTKDTVEEKIKKYQIIYADPPWDVKKIKRIRFAYD
jgi:16S rRNA G966 N2-methylase RsmD